MTEDDDGFDGMIGRTLESALKATQDRSKEPYDGVLGTLPAWVPDNFHAEFERARNQVLNDGYTLEEVQTFIKELIDTTKAALANPNKPKIVRPSIPLNRILEVHTLASMWTAVQMRKAEGLAFLTDPTHAGQVAKGEKYGKHQSSIAKKPRGKVSSGRTIDQIIGVLALEHEFERANDLWNYFIDALDERGLNPKEMEHAKDVKKRKVVYDFNRRKSIDRRKSMTFGTFAKVVSLYRAGRKKLP